MNDELVEVYRGGGGDALAQVLRSVLEGAGIECLVTGGWAGSQYPLTVGDMGEFALLVRAQDAERAAELLAEHT